MSSTNKALVRMVPLNIEMVLKQLTEQSQRVEELVHSPLQQMITQVENGAWIGEGANAFLEEVNSFYLPMVSRIIESCHLASNSLLAAMETFESADEQARSIASNLDDQFREIV